MILLLALGANSARAQAGRDAAQLQADAREAATKLGAARVSGAAEEARIDQAATQQKKMLDRAAQAAADLLKSPDPAEAAATRRGKESLATAMQNASPEGKMMLAQSAKRGPTSAPPKPEIIDGATSTTLPVATPPSATSGGGPKAVPLKPTSLENPEMSGNKVIITCTGAAFFDAEKSIALFTDNVEVRHPQFFVACDEFEVHMLQEPKDKDGKPIKPAPAPPPAPGAPGAPPAAAPAASPSAGSDGSIDKAIARGRMVTIEKLTETGEIQVGKCKHATYDGKTGNILLRDFPQVQRGQHLQIATSPATTMTLKQNGALDTHGPSRTEILQDSKPKGPTRLGTPAPAQGAPANSTTSSAQ